MCHSLVVVIVNMNALLSSTEPDPMRSEYPRCSRECRGRRKRRRRWWRRRNQRLKAQGMLAGNRVEGGSEA